jgi:hypothetical protein
MYQLMINVFDAVEYCVKIRYSSEEDTIFIEKVSPKFSTNIIVINGGEMAFYGKIVDIDTAVFNTAYRQVKFFHPRLMKILKYVRS